MKKNNITKKFNKVYSNGVTPYVTKKEAVKMYSSLIGKDEEKYIEEELNSIELLYKKSYLPA